MTKTERPNTSCAGRIFAMEIVLLRIHSYYFHFRLKFKENDAFVSFNGDTCASIVIHLVQSGWNDSDKVC